MMLKVLLDILERRAGLNFLTLIVVLSGFGLGQVIGNKLVAPMYEVGQCLTKDHIYIRITEVDEVNFIYVVEMAHNGSFSAPFYIEFDDVDEKWKLTDQINCVNGVN
jgi:hypothetical protein